MREHLYPGTRVRIIYTDVFRKKYPHTFKMYNEKKGVITGRTGRGPDQLVAVRVAGEKCETLIERQFLVEIITVERTASDDVLRVKF